MQIDFPDTTRSAPAAPYGVRTAIADEFRDEGRAGKAKNYVVTVAFCGARAKASVVSGPTIIHCTAVNAVSITR